MGASTRQRFPPVPVVRALESVRAALCNLNRRLVPGQIAVLEAVSEAWAAQAICVAARLGVADELRAGPLSAAEIAERLGTDPDATGRLLRALVDRSIFAESGGRYRLTRLSEYLRSDVEGSVLGLAQWFGAPEHWEHWGRLSDAVRTGGSAVEALRGEPLWDYLATEPELAAVFNGAMTSTSEMAIEPVLAAYDFSRFRTVVDVGGGHGRMLAAILARTPGVTGVLFDQQSVVAGAPAVLDAAGVASRCRIESGSFFDAVPSDADAYLLKIVIHDWADDDALTILRTVRRAIRAGGTLLLVESVLPEGTAPHFGKLLDLEMLVAVGGRERTAAEYANLLDRAGFRLRRVVPTVGPISIVEAVPHPVD